MTRVFALVFLFLILPALAFAQASQPASQPATIGTWLADNWQWLLLVVVIPSIINGLKEKTVRKGIIGFLASVLDRFSGTVNKDSPGSVKLPGTASKPPLK